MKGSSPSHIHIRQPSLFLKAVAVFLTVLIGCPLSALAAGPAIVPVYVRSGYDGNGNVVTRTDGNGVVTSFTYDGLNRLIAIDYPGGNSPDVAYAYDVNGNRTRMVDATGTTEYGYDIYDRLTGVGYPDSGFVTYGYDYAGNVTTLRYGNTKTATLNGGYTEIAYTYDADNRIATVKNIFANTTTSYTYDDAGHPLRRTLPNGVATDYAYDGDGRLTSVDHKKSDGTRICKYAYILNAIGNRTQVVETLPNGSTKTTSYTYDPLDRLSTVTYSDGRFVTYLYDSFGNRTKMTEISSAMTKVTEYICDNDSRLLSTKVNGFADETFSYNSSGNLVQRVRASDNRQIDYAYDFENRLVRYFDGTNNIGYLYDGSGRRVAKIVNGIRTNYVNDINRSYVQVLAETDPSGNNQRVYEWGNELLDQISGSNRTYHLQDAIDGSIRRLVDSSGGTSNYYEYDAFGTPFIKSELVANDYQFRGESQDDETGLVFLRARFCDPSTGRFLSRDPLSGMKNIPQTYNSYVYVLNNPVNRIDPSGKLSENGTIDFLASIATFDWGLFDSSYPQNYCGIASIRTAPTKWGEDVPGSNINENKGHAWVAAQNINSLQKIQQNACIAHDYAVVDHFTNLVDNRIANWNLAKDSPFPVMKILFGTMAAIGEVGHLFGSFFDFLGDLVGGVALDRSASVLLDINNITGGTYDLATGQIILIGTKDTSTTALPKINLDDLAVAVRAKQLGSFPEVSIEKPVVSNPPEWPGRDCGTVRYGPFYQDSRDGKTKVLDVSSKTHFGWVMFEADRLMKSLVLGQDNRTSLPVGSSVAGYHNLVDLDAQYRDISHDGGRFWFEPKEIIVQPSADGMSMQITKAEMQLSTEAAFASSGQVEGTPAAQYFATWFTNNYDAIADEQVSYDAANQPHKIYRELKQLAYLAGIVKWIDDNHIPVDLTFLKNYQPVYFAEAPSVTPQTTVSKKVNYGGGFSITYAVTGGVTFCNDLVTGTGGNPSGLGADAVTARPAEASLGWTFSSGGNNYNATAFSVDRTQKDGGMSPAIIDAKFQVNGAMPLTLGRYFNSSNITPTSFGWGWQSQPYALEFKGNSEIFSICHQSLSGFGEVWFLDRASKGTYKFVASGVYDKTVDPQGLASRFDPAKDIVVYRYESKFTPGLLYSDNSTHLTMRLDAGGLLDFNFDGLLTRVEDRNGNRINYNYDANGRLVSFGQPNGKTITLTYDAQNRVVSAALPDARTVAYTYDINGNLISVQIEAPTGMIAKYGYDANHNLTELRDESGNAAATQTFDVYGRVTGITQPGVTEPFTETYNLTTRTSKVTGPQGISRSMEFNEDYDPVKFTDARENSTKLTYNGYRDMTSMTPADGQTLRFYVDIAGHRVATVVPNGRADRTMFDNFGNPTVVFHGPVDSVFTSSFDSDHIMTSEGYSYFSTDYTQFSYDTRGNCVTITDANSRVRRFGYDSKGNMISSKDARGKETTISYDSNSRLTKTRNSLGHEVNSTYDAHDNLIQVSNQAGAIDYAYNTKNQVSSITTGNISARHKYSYTYDAKGKISTVTDPTSILTQYTYDARGNLTEIKHDGVVRFTYDYDAINRLTKTNYNGTSGGVRASVIPTSPVGFEQFTTNAPMNITWQTQGDWSGSPNITIQYSTNGTTWTDIATVNSASGSYQWSNPIVSDTLRVRFVHTGDSVFRVSVTSQFSVVATAQYYVNDNSTAGDQYCSAAGQVYNGTSITGRSPSNPVNDPQAIIDSNILRPGDTIYIDTGNYSLNHDIIITESDSGSVARPVSIKGPPSGPGAKLTRIASANPVNAVILIYDQNPNDSLPMQGIEVQNLVTAGSKRGIWLSNATNCEVINCESHHNGIAGSATQNGYGEGIFINGGGLHKIEFNKCHDNGGNGGAGANAGANGTTGTGFGIQILGSSNNIVRGNECYANFGLGGAAGSLNSKPGASQSVGINIAPDIQISDNNLVDKNICRDSISQGITVLNGYPGSGFSYGIVVNNSTNSKVLNNTIYGLVAVGGNSTAQSGGRGFCVGLYAISESFFAASGNLIYNNQGLGGLGGTAISTVGNGEADGVAIWASGSPGARFINNLGYDNFAMASAARGVEMRGGAYAGGLFLSGSSGSRVLNNTFCRNRPTLSNSGSLTDQSGQIFIFNSSTSCLVQNNIGISFDADCPAIYFDSSSQSGIFCNYNNFYSQGGAIGLWGSTICPTLTIWRSNSGGDANSTSSDPKFYSVASNNFHLAFDSPMIDAGSSIADVTSDIDGESRPVRGPSIDSSASFDVGCDEFVDSDGDKLPDTIETNVTMTDLNDRDSDNDDLPDDWEVANGLNPNDSLTVNGKSGDPDNDGYSNFQEYLGRSSPKNAGSIPSLPPIITTATPSSSDQLIFEEESINFTATASDANNDAISYLWRLDGVVKSTSDSYLFDTNGDSSGLTTLIKSYAVELRVLGGVDEVVRSWTVTVKNRNHAPVLAAMGNLNVRPGNTIQLSPVYSDPDNQNLATGDDNTLAVNYSGFMSLPTKLITQADIGSHNVTVSVRDDGNPTLNAQRTFQVNVINAGVQVNSIESPLVVTEGKAQSLYNIVLSSAPSAPVTVNVNTSAPLEVNRTSLVFTSANWDIPQVIGVSAHDNFIPEGDHPGLITHAVASTDSLYGEIPVPDVAVTIKDPAFDEWRSSFFSAAELLDSSVSGDLADPNHNGIPILIEYALGGEPRGVTTAGQKFLPSALMNSTGKLQIAFDRYVGRDDITLTVEGANMLTGPWEILAKSTSGAPFSAEDPGVITSETGEGNTRRVTIVDAYKMSDPGQSKRFVRLKVKRP